MYYYNNVTKEFIPATIIQNFEKDIVSSTTVDPTPFLPDLKDGLALYFDEDYNVWDLTFNWLGKPIYNKQTKNVVYSETVCFPIHLNNDEYTQSEPLMIIGEIWDEKKGQWGFNSVIFLETFMKLLSDKLDKKIDIQKKKTKESIESSIAKLLLLIEMDSNSQGFVNLINDLRRTYKHHIKKTTEMIIFEDYLKMILDQQGVNYKIINQMATDKMKDIITNF